MGAWRYSAPSREHYALLQGWGLPLQGGCDVILAGTAFRRYRGREACFARPDILEPSLGQALVLPAEAAEAGVVESVFLLARDGIRRRPVLPERRKLSETETAAHFRDMLPQIRCDAETRAILVAALRPRYEGRLTLHERGHPVRLNVDLAVGADGAGCYLTGWLYDPAHLVESVHFRSAPGVTVRLDHRWTRIPRPDVTDGFSADPNLPAFEPGRHGHGFAVHVPEGGASTTDKPYLEITLHDGWCGFVPLSPVSINGVCVGARLLASVDLHKPSGAAVIERQLAPFFSRIAAPPPVLERVLDARPQWSSLIIVPLSAPEPPRALLSQLLGDPLDSDEGILFCLWRRLDRCRHSRPGGLGPLLRRDRRSGARGRRCHRSDGAHDRCGGNRCRAGLAARRRHNRPHPGLAPRAPDHRARTGGRGLRLADGALRGQFHSLRRLRTVPSHSRRRPYVKLRRRLAGLPASFAPLGPATVTAGVSASCCLIPRTVLTAMQGQAATVATSAWEPELGPVAADQARERCLLFGRRRCKSTPPTPRRLRICPSA